MNKEIDFCLSKYEITYEIHKGSKVSRGICERWASTRDIASNQVKEEIYRRFKGASKIVIY
ncbi:MULTISPECIES: hypothetical protein [Bacillus cereus group]|uniref:hypothetical protein n=1 Tax=Bacillus cereus group TaxID=86661 RepID=UPI0005CF2CA6|nr:MULTISPECIES: hypothetical protein [Bacillus cereus group]